MAEDQEFLRADYTWSFRKEKLCPKEQSFRVGCYHRTIEIGGGYTERIKTNYIKFWLD